MTNTKEKARPTPVDEALRELEAIGAKKRRWYSWRGTDTYANYVKSLSEPRGSLTKLMADIDDYRARWATTRFVIRVLGIGDIKRKQGAYAYFRVCKFPCVNGHSVK